MAEKTPRPRWRRLVKWVGLPAVCVAAATLALLAYTGQLGDNFREVTPGAYYRSGQMSSPAFDEALKGHGIKCVIDLRGGVAGDSWYHEESRICLDRGAEYVSLFFSAQELPEPLKVQALVERLQKGPYPMLVHCMAGADRTGLASVLYKMVKENQPLEQALAQLSWRYGHLSVGPTGSMDRFFDLYRQTGGGRDIKTWIFETYPSEYAREISQR